MLAIINNISDAFLLNQMSTAVEAWTNLLLLLGYEVMWVCNYIYNKHICRIYYMMLHY